MTRQIENVILYQSGGSTLRLPLCLDCPFACGEGAFPLPEPIGRAILVS